MSHTEIIDFGNIRVFADVASIFEFYERLGILDRLNENDIESPVSIKMHPDDFKVLKDMIFREAKRRPRFVWGATDHSPIFFEWITFSPMNTGRKRGTVEITAK